MAIYVATKKCFGFRKRLWQKDETVDIGKDEKPPKHFRLLRKSAEPGDDKDAKK